MIKAGIIGLGVGESHINGYNSHADCEVVSICDFDPRLEPIAKEKYSSLEFTSNANDILNNPDIDVVSIASYDALHFDQIILGLENDKHLFIEKPIVTNRVHAQKVKSLIEQKPNLKICSNLILRKIERFAQLKTECESNAFGDFSNFNMGYHYGRINKIINGWRGDFEDYSIVMGGGIHLVDLLLWLSKGTIESVYATGNKIQSANSKFKNADYVVAVLNFKEGYTATVTCNFGGINPHYHQVEIFGTKLSFINNENGGFYYNQSDVKNGNYNYLLNKPVFAKYEGKTVAKSEYKTISKGDYIYEFVESIINNKKSPISKSEIFDALSVCLAIEDSLKQKQLVKVNYL